MKSMPTTRLHAGADETGGVPRRRARRRAVAAVALPVLIAALLGACGDDDDESSDGAAATPAAAGGDTSAFCSAVVEFNGAAMNTEVDESSSKADVVAAGETLAPVLTTIVDNAPDDIAGTAATLDETVQALLDGDAGPFSADESFETFNELLGGAAGACDFEQVDVGLVDYGFDAPDTLEAGTYALSLTNESDAEAHEMVMMRKNDGVTLTAEELLELPEEEAMGNLQPVTFGFAPPGGTSTTLAELTAGEYIMVCFIPVGGAEEGAPHFTAGMVHELSVT